MTESCRITKSTIRHLFGEPTLEGLAHYIKLHNIRKILCLVGAGASVAAGIPDFRSPQTGLYAKLGKYNLQDPTDSFSLALLREDPTIFFTIAGEMNMWPGFRKPTAVHHFIKLLADEGRLLRCCTQNIDGLERAAGLSEKLLVEAHGSFRTSSCIDCHQLYDTVRVRQGSDLSSVSRCASCGGIVKPDIVFFGEQLPERFFDVLTHDTQEADLVIIIGTSLQVRPFALLPIYVRNFVPRVVFNMERVGGRMFYFPEDDLSEEAASEYDGNSTLTFPVTTPDASSAPLNGTLAADRNEVAMLNDNRGLDNAGVVHKFDDNFSDSSSEGFITEHEEALSRPDVCRDMLVKGDCQVSILHFADCLGLGDRLRSVTLDYPCR